MATNALRTSGSNREWFVDPRGVERRLQVTGHGDARTVVLSIWRGNACTGTFQLPVEETPRLIAHLADCLSASMPETPSLAYRAPRGVSTWRHRVLRTVSNFVARGRGSQH